MTPPPDRDREGKGPGEAEAPAWQLNLRALRVFIAVEETGSIAAAAARMGASASGVSQGITLLETTIGARLFDRRTRPFALTPAGRKLGQHARRILSVISEAETDLAAFNLGSMPALNLAIIDDLDTTLTPALATALMARFPRSFVTAFSGRSDHILARLENREADIAVTARLPEDGAAFTALPILREPFVLALARGARGVDEGGRAAVERLPFVRYSDSIPLGLRVSLMLRRARLDPARRMAFETTRSVIAMVERCGGWTVTTPLNLLDAEPQLQGIEILPLPFAAETRRVHLLARRDELGRLPQDLAEACREIVRRRLSPRFDALVPALAGALAVEDEDGDEG